MLGLLTIYYQCDVSAYSVDGKRSILNSIPPRAEVDRNAVFENGQLIAYSRIAQNRPLGACFYAGLEDQAHANLNAPNAKYAYPSLDFLLKLNPQAELYAGPRYVRSTDANRLLFADAIEEVMAGLEE